MKTLLLIVTRNQKLALFQTLRGLKASDPAQTVDTLVIDDASDDDTLEAAREYVRAENIPEVQVIRNGRRQGFGGNMKVGFRYALDRGYTTVVTLPAAAGAGLSVVSGLLKALEEAPADVACVLGLPPSSILDLAFNGLLVPSQNILNRTRLKGWHSFYRAYRVSALAELAFELNTAEPHFNTEILQQVVDRGFKVRELFVSAPRYRAVGSTGRYVWNTLKTSLKYRLQTYNLFFDVRYHPEVLKPETVKPHRAGGYHEKFDSQSPHRRVIQDPDLIAPGSRVLDLGCSTGYVARRLTEMKGCQVVGIDRLPPEEVERGSFQYHQLDLETDAEKIYQIIETGAFDVILMLDVIEHLADPEVFLLHLYRRKYAMTPTFIFSTANVAFFVVRMMLFAGYFNYGNKGILDVTHKRLLSLRTFKNLLDQTGFLISRRYGFPLPYRELGLPDGVCRLLEQLNMALIFLRPSLFAYQIMFVATPLVSPEQVLQETLPAGAPAAR